MSTRKASFIAGFFVLVIVLTFLPGARHLLAQDSNTQGTAGNGPPAGIAQFVALDGCDPTTFNAALGPAFCKNVALAAFGYATKLSDLLAGAAAGHPSPNWDFEPDSTTVSPGTVISVVNQGGEPHTFTEVKNFGGGFLGPLNGAGGDDGSRMFERLFDGRGGQDPDHSGQHNPGPESIERATLVSMLYPSVDARDGERTITRRFIQGRPSARWTAWSPSDFR
jgi:plastocyanin